ncbi:cupredoxin domain-containing protein [Rhodococcus sp. UNC363MFTsu5.1]|uniref:cupredoxin domain-containing protein n=1 Tax=Rhodococcus sp. UNC363MFTsu5.1 TaxID=1449069 RepID=UPI00047FD6D6|nr:plastocyanin/azurin family copper-binding protein [Rhodococcus sp. UNC363MFTsu5.1]
MRALGATIATGLLVASVLAGTAGPAQARDKTVEINNNAFWPSTTRILIGDTVTWEFNDEGVEHNVTATGKGTAEGDFASGTMSEGEFSHYFSRQGTYPYECTLHPQMGGTIIVR